jgi:hypothetical protein
VKLYKRGGGLLGSCREKTIGRVCRRHQKYTTKYAEDKENEFVKET